jgi:N-carbamoyl-L-amino-acid hydrolase
MRAIELRHLITTCKFLEESRSEYSALHKRNINQEPRNKAMKYQVLAEDIFNNIYEISKDSTGVTRPGFHQTETETIEYLETVAHDLNITTFRDPAGNIVFASPEYNQEDYHIIIGSHVDSVPKGGNYDGLAGVVAGLLVLHQIQQAQEQPEIPAIVIGFRGEESPWFGHCHLGSKAVLGKISGAELASRHSLTDESLEDHFQKVGANVGLISKGTPLLNIEKVTAYLELHIEQGPTLVSQEIPVSAVSGIRGIYRHRTIKCHGESGHSGAVPQSERRDALLAAATLINSMEEHCHNILKSERDLVLTSGIFSTDTQNHSITRIPDYVSFSFEVRSISEEVLIHMEATLHNECAHLEKERGVTFEIDPLSIAEPVKMNQRLTDSIVAAIESENLQPFIIPSGAGHDASVFAESGFKTGMIFVRNFNGSHRPEEHLDLNDFMKGVAVLKPLITEIQE